MSWLLAVLGALVLHPLHTTLTQLAYREADGTVEATVRVFADDFRAALRGEVTDSAAVVYLRSTFALADSTGRALVTAWCGIRRTGDLLWLCLRAPAAQGLSGLRVRVALLFDRYADQINIVQATYGGRRVALLFTSGDEAKPLP
jgi:hypothetical protein